MFQHKPNDIIIVELIMDKVKPLAEKTFLLYASKHYNNPQCESIDEFYEDLNRIKYVKRLLRKFVKSGVLRERLILNHLIILQNVFGASCSSRMLFFKIDKELFPQLKTFLVYLNYLPETIPEVKVDEIPLDATIITQLRKI